jgi:archaellum component FlaC
VADEPDNLVLVLLQRMNDRLVRMDEKIDRLVDDVRDPKVRMSNVEEGLGGVNRRLDRLEVRVERIEKRLELVDSPYGGVRE